MHKNKTKLSREISETSVPSDFRKSLLATSKLRALWDDLTPIARRDFITWIESAKQQETRSRRIAVACSKLLAGKRRPCCYAVVPMNLYKALGADPKAKKQWSELTPSERRDFVEWIDSGKVSDTQKDRVEKVRVMLTRGMRNP